jgi:hypothetical protein
MRKKDIRQVLTLLGASTFKDSGESIMTNCVLAPFTHEGGTDRKPSLGVKEDQGMSVAHCFTCGFSGGLISLVRRYASYAVPEGFINEEDVKQLIDFIFIAEDEEVETVPELVEIVRPSENIINSIGVWHDYFESRGITRDSFDLWKLGFYADHERIIFPVFNTKEIVGAVGRTIRKDEDVKYRNYPAKFKKSFYLYGLNLLKTDVKKLIVVEGPIDAVKVNQYLKESSYWCVALMGSEPSKAQMDLLVENAEEVVCMLDNDSSGKKGRKDLLAGIGKRVLVSFVEYPNNANDPDQVGEDIFNMLENRISAVEWQLKNVLLR